MLKRHVALGLATIGVMAMSGFARASEISAASQLTLDQPVLAQADAAETTLLQGGLDGVSNNFFSDAGITVGGWAEASYTYSASAPPGNVITGRAFDFEHEDPTFNQLALFVDKGTDFAKPGDIGFRVEGGWGGDYRFTSSNGMDFQTGSSPDEQFDLTQAYVEIVPAVNWKVKVGKFITPLGWEYVNPTLNALYSHSFLFGLVPYSHTGVLASYQASDQLTLSFGFSRGWDQSLKDNNGDALDAIFSLAYTISENTSYFLNMTWGPEGTDSGYYTLAIDSSVSHTFSDQLTGVLNAVYIYNAGASQTGDGANTWGVAGYLSYQVSDMFTLNGRAEWMNDEMRAGGFDTNLYEVTGGVTITPFPTQRYLSSLKIRPEVRMDFAHDSVFDAGTDQYQFTAGVDAIYSF